MIINAAEAYKAVLRELLLRAEDIEFYDFAVRDGLYEMALFTAWMRYDCYVDAVSGEVMGLSAQPMLLYSAEQHEAKFEFLRGTLNFTA